MERVLLKLAPLLLGDIRTSLPRVRKFPGDAAGSLRQDGGADAIDGSTVGWHLLPAASSSAAAGPFV